jgi:hypothetical protein
LGSYWVGHSIVQHTATKLTKKHTTPIFRIEVKPLSTVNYLKRIFSTQKVITLEFLLFRKDAQGGVCITKQLHITVTASLLPTQKPTTVTDPEPVQSSSEGLCSMEIVP